MARLGRRAALTALWAAMRSSHRGGPSLGRRLAALPRMLGATLSGRYEGKGRVFGMVLALLYIVSPIDLVPEALFTVFGLVDDSFPRVENDYILPLHLHSVQELNARVGQFFDEALYDLARGYEDRARTVR